MGSQETREPVELNIDSFRDLIPLLVSAGIGQFLPGQTASNSAIEKFIKIAQQQLERETGSTGGVVRLGIDLPSLKTHQPLYLVFGSNAILDVWERTDASGGTVKGDDITGVLGGVMGGVPPEGGRPGRNMATNDRSHDDFREAFEGLFFKSKDSPNPRGLEQAKQAPIFFESMLMWKQEQSNSPEKITLTTQDLGLVFFALIVDLMAPGFYGGHSKEIDWAVVENDFGDFFNIQEAADNILLTYLKNLVTKPPGTVAAINVQAVMTEYEDIVRANAEFPLKLLRHIENLPEGEQGSFYEAMMSEGQEDNFSDQDRISMMRAFLVGGTETLQSAITEMLYQIVQGNIDSADPRAFDRSFDRNSPVNVSPRFTGPEGAVIDGYNIPANSLVMLMVAGMVGEQGVVPNNFFGEGVHACIGFAYARIIGKLLGGYLDKNIDTIRVKRNKGRKRRALNSRDAAFVITPK